MSYVGESASTQGPPVPAQNERASLGDDVAESEGYEKELTGEETGEGCLKEGMGAKAWRPKAACGRRGSSRLVKYNDDVYRAQPEHPRAWLGTSRFGRVMGI